MRLAVPFARLNGNVFVLSIFTIRLWGLAMVKLEHTRELMKGSMVIATTTLNCLLYHAHV